jgi:hypothetical protein
MGNDGKPTEIDFTKQFVLAIVLPVANLATEITPDRLDEKGDTLFYFYDAKVGEAQSYSTQPISLVILDKKYMVLEPFRWTLADGSQYPYFLGGVEMTFAIPRYEVEDENA